MFENIQINSQLEVLTGYWVHVDATHSLNNMIATYQIDTLSI